MRFSSIRSGLSSPVLIVTVQCLLLDYVSSLRCFVCDSDTESVNSLNCDNFQSLDNTFAKECPNDSRGSCSITKKEGTIISRSCEQFHLNDCQIANNVQYCYCTTDLCNGNAHVYLENISDDEDISEGSGLITTKPSLPKELVPVVHSSNIGLSFVQKATCELIVLLQYFVIRSVL